VTDGKGNVADRSSFRKCAMFVVVAVVRTARIVW